MKRLFSPTIASFLLVFGGLYIAPFSASAALPAGFVLDTVGSGFVLPTKLIIAQNGDMLVAEKHGIVRLVQNGITRATPVVTLANVNDYADHGLLSIALDEVNHHLYLLYTYENNPASYQGPKTSQLARVTLDDTMTAIAGTQTVILGSVVGTPATPSCLNYATSADCIASDGASHSIADLGFGPDGKLYVSAGDASSFDYVDVLAQRAQSLDTLSGKVLRINPDGTGPADNPFYNGDATSNRSKIYAYGFRNPFRFTFRPGNGAMYLGDVGWYTAEEINVVTAGGNYGWPCHEGNGTTEGYYCTIPTRIDPLYTYEHQANGSGSAVGGVFYQGGNYPATYNGSYFFGDFSQNWIKRMVVSPTNGLVSIETFMTQAGGPVSFALDNNGDINYLSIYSGQIRRIRAVVGNRNPIADFTATPTSGVAPLSVAFSSANSSDPDGNPLTYAWAFGDGGASTLANPTHTYTTNGTYYPVLTLTDGLGGIASTTLKIIVGNQAPTATIVNPPNGSFYSSGQIIPLTGSATDPEDGILSASHYAWTVILHHNVHYHILETLTGTNPSFAAPDHGADADVHIEVRLDVTDSVGLVDTKSINMYLAPPASVAPYHVLTTVSPIGGDVNTPITVTSLIGNTGSSTPFLIDLELFDSNNVRVAQQFYDQAIISNGATHPYTLGHTPTTAGTYRVAVGLIYEGWKGLYQWVGNALTFVVSSLWSPTAPNGALIFDGVNDYIETGFWNIEETNGFTLEARFVPESFAGDQYIISKASGNTDSEIDWAFGTQKVSNTNTEAQLLFQLRTANGGLATLTGGSVAPGEFVHASVVYTGTTMEIFKNGVSVGTVTKNGAIATGQHHVWLGARADALTNAFQGRVDEIRVWNVPRSVTEINALKDGELTQKENGLIKDWRFNEGFGQVVIDSSNSGHHGTLGSANTVDTSDPTRLAGKYPTGGTFTPTLGAVVADQNPLLLGATTNITVPVTNTGDGAGFMIVNVEIYDPAGNLLTQKFFDGEGFASGETRNFSVPFTGATLGNYRVAVGLVHLFWSDAYSWTGTALTVTVSNITQTPFALAHTSTVITDPSTAVGDPATLSTTITNTGTSNGVGVIDFEIFDANGAQVYQQFYQGEAFTGGQSRTFTANFTPSASGTYRIAIGLIHDGWAGLYQWVNEAQTVTVGQTTTAPGGVIYADTLVDGWSNWSWGSTIDLLATPAHSGTTAIAVTYTDVWGGLYLNHPGFDTTGKTQIHFFIRSVGTAPLLQITGLDTAGNPLLSKALAPYLSTPISTTDWTEVIIPLADLSMTNIISRGMMIQGMTGQVEPAFLIDAITIN